MASKVGPGRSLLATDTSKDQTKALPKIKVVDDARLLFQNLTKQKQWQQPSQTSGLEWLDSSFPEIKKEFTLDHDEAQIICSQVSPDGRFFAFCTLEGRLIVKQTQTWERLMDKTIFEPVRVEEKTAESSHTNIKLTPHRLFFFPDSEHIGLYFCSEWYGFKLFSIPKKQEISQIYAEDFISIGKVFVDGTPTAKAQLGKAQSSGVWDYAWLNIDGSQFCDPEGTVTHIPRPDILVLVFNLYICFIKLKDWDYESPLTERTFFIRPKALDLFKLEDLKSAHLHPNLKLILTTYSTKKLHLLTCKEDSLKRLFQVVGSDDSPVTSIRYVDELEYDANPIDLPLTRDWVEELSIPTQNQLLVYQYSPVSPSLHILDTSNLKITSHDCQFMTKTLAIFEGKYWMGISGSHIHVYYRSEGKPRLMCRLRLGSQENDRLYFLRGQGKILFKDDKQMSSLSVELFPIQETYRLELEAEFEPKKCRFAHVWQHNTLFLFLREEKTCSLYVWHMESEATPDWTKLLEGLDKESEWMLSSCQRYFCFGRGKKIWTYDLVEKELRKLVLSEAKGSHLNGTRLYSDKIVAKYSSYVGDEREEQFLEFPIRNGKLAEADTTQKANEKWKRSNLLNGFGAGEFSFDMVKDEARETCHFKVFDSDANLVGEFSTHKQLSFRFEWCPPTACLLLWNYNTLMVVFKNNEVVKKPLEFDVRETLTWVDLSPDGKFLLTYAAGSKLLQLVTFQDMKVLISIVLESAPVAEVDYNFFMNIYQQWWWVDEQTQTFACLEGETNQKLRIYCLHKLHLIAKIELPKEVYCQQIIFKSKEKAIYLMGTDDKRAVMIKVQLSADTNCRWDATRSMLRDIQVATADGDVKGHQEAKSMLLDLWQSIPKHLLSLKQFVPFIVYQMADIELMKSFEQRILDAGSLAVFNHLLDFALYGIEDTNLLEYLQQLMKDYLSRNELPVYLQSHLSLLLQHQSHSLSANNLTVGLSMALLFKNTQQIQRGELIATDLRLLPIDALAPSKSTESVCSALLKRNPRHFQDFKIYSTRTEFDLTNGSKFSCALFDFAHYLPDKELSEQFRPLVYYKWRRLFPWAVAYCILFWSNNILAYLYLGYLPDVDGLGIAIIVLSALMLLFEVKTWVTNPRNYMRSSWNVFDLLIQLFAIAAVIYNFSSSEADRLERRSNIWMRFLPVLLLGLRSVTWLRIFTSTRYLVTMVMEVFQDMAPFLIILIAILMIYAYALRLAPGLYPESAAPAINFYTSVLTSANMIFGNSADPLGEGNPYDLLSFLVYVVGSVVLALVMLNFLIALISGTSERVSQDKYLHDVKELLPVIQDFDLFLAGTWLSKFQSLTDRIRISISSTPKPQTKGFFALLVEESQSSEEKLETSMQELVATVEAKQESRFAELHAELAGIKSEQLKLAESVREMHHLLLRESPRTRVPVASAD